MYKRQIFGPGAIGFAEETPPGEDGLEYDRAPDRGNGGGTETLWTRRNFVVHPLGFSFDSVTITGTPTTSRPISANWADLALATNWSRKFARKQVPMAFITSLVTAPAP